ncbi:tetratricopeptide repeat protein [Kutzneria kofuensis]|uniref:Tetratricopeptide (TPR) repeat protein n=1 Tax=Kutzneria kofuensis TaxID=103725 RepID=A0A7W9KHZ0_9PSEU|nr:tetratricopeptide repeat protein [Kutzneria kofuensis]MBB5892578.1 tetratricopeptide (TPR) repeat protein [Kutzneria kofuensis]
MSAETVAALQETVEKCRARAAEDPSRRTDLATALTRLGVAYNDHGEYPDAVATAEEAVETWRLVADHRSELADALTTLSSYYAGIGLDDEAAACAEEAAEVMRPGRG